MATTTNNGWTTPADTDLVRNGASAIRTLGNAIDSSIGKLTYTTFTPSITGTGSGWSLGTSSSATGRYIQVGQTVFADGTITLGTSPSAGSNAFAIALPVNANSNTSEWITTGWFYDTSANELYPCTIKISPTLIEFYYQKATSSTGPIVAKALTGTSTTPVVPASGDVFGFSISYQAA
jgi:hypothetical protein